MYDFNAAIQKQPGPLDQYAQLLQLKSAQQGQQANEQNAVLRQQQIAENDQQLKARERAMRDQETIFQAQAADPKNWLTSVRGKISAGAYAAALKEDAATREHLAKTEKAELDLMESKNGQFIGLINQAQALPDEQYAASWPQIMQAAEQLHPGTVQQYQLNPQNPVPKQQLGRLGIGLMTMDSYIKQAKEAHDAAMRPGQVMEQTAKTAKEQFDAMMKQRELAGTDAQGITAAKRAELASQKRGQDITARGQNMTDARMRKANEIANEMKQAQVEKLQRENRQADAATLGRQASYNVAIDSLDRMVGNKEKGIKQHPGFESAVGLSLSKVFFPVWTPPGTDRADFEAQLEATESQLFLPAVQSMRGMGQLSNAEGQKLQTAWGSLKTAQSEASFQRQAAIIRAGLERLKKISDVEAGRGGGNEITVSPEDMK